MLTPIFEQKQKLFIKIRVLINICSVSKLLTYNGTFSAIPDTWKRSVPNSEETLDDSDEYSLTLVNVTAKIARKMCAGNAYSSDRRNETN